MRRSRECVGAETAEEWELGKLQTTLTCRYLLTSNQALHLWKAGTETSLQIIMEDDRPAADSPLQHTSYTYDFARVKLMQAGVPTPTQGEDVLIELEAQALQPTGGDQVTITRLTD